MQKYSVWRLACNSQRAVCARLTMLNLNVQGEHVFTIVEHVYVQGEHVKGEYMQGEYMQGEYVQGEHV